MARIRGDFFRLTTWEKGSKGEVSGNKDRLQVAAQGNMRYGDGGNRDVLPPLN